MIRSLEELASLAKPAANDSLCRLVAEKCSPTRSYKLIMEFTSDVEKARSCRWLAKLKVEAPDHFRRIKDEHSKAQPLEPFKMKPNYSVSFLSEEISVYNIGTDHERELNPSSTGSGMNFYARNLEEAIAMVTMFFRGWENGGESMVFNHSGDDVTVNNRFHTINEKICLWPILLNGERGERIDLTYESIFEKQKQGIRDNLKRSKEDRLKRLQTKKRDIEKQIKEQEESPVPISSL